MTFKEIIEADIKNVFINFDEFASAHTINGKEILAVVCCCECCRKHGDV